MQRRNFQLAFDVGADYGIARSLVVDEMVSLERPDWQAVMNYVTAVYTTFENHHPHLYKK